MPDQPPQYVWHKLCAEKGDGEKWEVIFEHGCTWECKAPTIPHLLSLCLPKSEYIPCPPPERWERVPIETRLAVREWGRSVRTHGADKAAFCEDNECFRIIDGALVLERRVQG